MSGTSGRNDDFSGEAGTRDTPGVLAGAFAGSAPYCRLSEKQRAAIEVRRQFVGRFLSRGSSVREIHAGVAAMTVAGPGGARVRVCVNPVTGAPWCVATIGEDVKFLKEGWKEALEQERQSHLAELLAVVRELRRVAFASGDLRAVSASIKQEREMFGVDLPKQREVPLAAANYRVTNEHDPFVDPFVDLLEPVGESLCRVRS